jgi:hypothetical protein
MFDIPPQLYVSNQYLSAVFKKRVLSYREALALKPSGEEAFLRQVKGKIVILPTWKMPQWRNFKIDLFWNSASFQEMEPKVVENYLGLVKTMSPESVYIHALPGGNYWGKRKPGEGGTLDPVLSQYYGESLSPEYKLSLEYVTDNLLREKDYRSYIFSKVC